MTFSYKLNPFARPLVSTTARTTKTSTRILSQGHFNTEPSSFINFTPVLSNAIVIFFVERFAAKQEE